jgi:hypothetical protein
MFDEMVQPAAQIRALRPSASAESIGELGGARVARQLRNR